MTQPHTPMNAPSLRSRAFQSASLGIAILALGFPGFGSAQTAAQPDPPVKPSVSGKFIGNGKPAAVKFVIVEECEPFADEPAIKLLFTENDPSKSKKPSFDAMFGKLGSALSLSVDYNGKIFGCVVSHTAHEKQGFTALGRIKMAEFKIAGGNATGHVTTNGELDAFGEKWEVDLTFAAPLPEKIRNAPAAPPKKQVAKASDEEKPAKPTGPAIPANTLPIPKSATGVEFKKLVEQIHFSSPQPVAAVTKELSAGLKQQGWKEGPGNLEGKANAILKREQGASKLTIMIQPAGSGSTVRILTVGLDWSGTDATAPAPPAAETGADEIENDARKMLDDALKNLPR